MILLYCSRFMTREKTFKLIRCLEVVENNIKVSVTHIETGQALKKKEKKEVLFKIFPTQWQCCKTLNASVQQLSVRIKLKIS